MSADRIREARRLIWTLKYGIDEADLQKLARILNYVDAETLQNDINAAWELIRAEQAEK